MTLRRLLSTSFILAALLVAGCADAPPSDSLTADTIQTLNDDELRTLADELAQKYILVDGHIDVPYRLTKTPNADVANATDDGDFDYERARAGGLNAPFMSIYIPASYQENGGAYAFADSLIDMVTALADANPEKFAVATSPADVRQHFDEGLISLPMGMENGAGIEDDATNLKHFYDRGIRYITLTHSKDNLISDSSYDDARTLNGLSAFGREVVREMNRLGIMVDISHVSDSAFYQVLDVTRAPVIASHSSARHFTEGFERNMSDDMIRRLAENGGVIMINFGSSFLSDAYRARRQAADEHIAEYVEDNELSDEDAATYRTNYYREHVGYADLDDVVAHFEHVRELVGVDHIGIGSDYDGVGDSLPSGLKDVSEYPNLIYALLKTGNYTEEDIAKIMGGNVLRVWEAVEAAAAGS